MLKAVLLIAIPLAWLWGLLWASHLARADGFGRRRNLKTPLSFGLWWAAWIGFMILMPLLTVVLPRK